MALKCAVLGDCLSNGPTCAIGALSVCLSVCLTLVCCGQTVGWIQMKLGIEVGLVPGYIVLDGVLAPRPQKGAQLPNFRPVSVVAKRSPIHMLSEGMGQSDGRTANCP